MTPMPIKNSALLKTGTSSSSGPAAAVDQQQQQQQQQPNSGLWTGGAAGELASTAFFPASQTKTTQFA